MSSSSVDNTIIEVAGVRKEYTLYRRPLDRLKHLLMPWREYPSFHALSDISLSVDRGETIGLIGRNGAGKSTLLQILTGTLTPSAGSVKVNGRVAALLELGAGFEPEFSGRENVYLNATILGLKIHQVDERFDDIVAFSELEEFIDRPVKTYSSGMFMRLAFSVAAHVDADVLIIDEALSVGDALFTQKCMRFLRDFQKRGTILFVSHDLGAVTSLCSRAVWLDQGRIRSSGDAKRVCEEYLEITYEIRAKERTAGTTPSDEAVPDFDDNTLTVGDEVVLLDAPAPPADPRPHRSTKATVSPFDPEQAGFGEGGGYIHDVRFVSPSGERRQRIAGGEEIVLEVEVGAERVISSAIVGFYIKDRTGQMLFGDNSVVGEVKPPPLRAGARATARFAFQMPLMAAGTYVVTAALAEGTLEEHTQLHWMHEAIAFDVHSTSLKHGLVGIPMHRISWRRET